MKIIEAIYELLTNPYILIILAILFLNSMIRFYRSVCGYSKILIDEVYEDHLVCRFEKPTRKQIKSVEKLIVKDPFEFKRLLDRLEKLSHQEIICVGDLRKAFLQYYDHMVDILLYLKYIEDSKNKDF